MIYIHFMAAAGTKKTGRVPFKISQVLQDADDGRVHILKGGIMNNLYWIVVIFCCNKNTNEYNKPFLPTK